MAAIFHYICFYLGIHFFPKIKEIKHWTCPSLGLIYSWSQ